MSASVRQPVVASVDVDPSLPDFAAVSDACPMVRICGSDNDVDRDQFDPFLIALHLSEPKNRLFAPNDRLLVGPTTYRFGDQHVSSMMAADSGPEITLERSARFADPIDAFALFLRQLDRLQLSLDPRNPTTRRRFPWVDETWKSIRVSWHANAFARRVMVEIYDGLVVWVDRETLEVECPFLAQNRTRSLAEIAEMVSIVRACLVVYCDERPRPAVSDFLDAVCECRRRHEADDGLSSSSFEYSNLPNGRTAGSFEGPLSAVRSVMAELSLLAGVHCMLLPPDTTFRMLPSPPRSIWKLIDKTDRSIAPMPGAHLRWPFNCSILVDVALIFYALLPPYVLLEIVDWLPVMSRQNRVRKVAVLEGVVASVERLGKMIPWRQKTDPTI